MTADEAKSAYRAAWLAWGETDDQTLKRQLENTMDRLQPAIAERPTDRAWQDFAKTLPGFLEFWNRAKQFDPEILRQLGMDMED